MGIKTISPEGKFKIFYEYDYSYSELSTILEKLKNKGYEIL